MLEWFKNMVAGKAVKRWLGQVGRPALPPGWRARPMLESLEDRMVPSATMSPIAANQVMPGTAKATFHVGDSIKSPNGEYELILQGDGNFVEYNKDGKAGFSTNTSGSGAVEAVMQGDGNFVLYDSSGNAVYSTNTAGNDGAFLQLRNDGKVIISQGNAPLFAKGPSEGWDLRVGDTPILSPDGQNKLIMQGDGNLVLYNSSGQATWSSNTAGSGAVDAAFQSDGNLVLYTSDGKAVFSTHTDGNPHDFLQVQDDGKLAIYNKTDKIYPHHHHK